jgi:protein-S-isoprenylcysteine O-methyltransferase Ste14
MGRLLIVAYGILSYVAFFLTFLYTIGFLSAYVVPKTINSGAERALLPSIVINVGLLGLFAIQHTVMARPAFKERWVKIIPPATERSTFVLVTSLLLALLMWQWSPLPDVVWSVEGVAAQVLWVICAVGWGIVLLSSFLIDHFDLFGLRQVVLAYQGKPYTPPKFVERLLYGYVRHPLMLGFLIAFWAAPQMTVGHLLFSITTTLYILFGIRIEERDLLAAHGEDYANYRQRVSMVLPFPRKAKA